MSRNRAAERESKESKVVKKTTLQCPQLKLLTASRTCELGTHEGAHEFPGAAVATPSLKSGHRGFLGVRGDPCPSLPQAAGGVGSSSFLWQHLPSLGLLFLSQISLSLTLFFFFPLSSAPGPAEFPGQGSDLSHSCHLHQSRGNAGPDPSHPVRDRGENHWPLAPQWELHLGLTFKRDTCHWSQSSTDNPGWSPGLKILD